MTIPLSIPPLPFLRHDMHSDPALEVELFISNRAARFYVHSKALHASDQCLNFRLYNVMLHG
jgi:hypothetical protein